MKLVSAPVMAVLFIVGVVLLFGGMFMIDFGLVLLVLGTLAILTSLYLSKRLAP